MAAGTAQESRLAIVIDTRDAEERIKELRKQLRELGGQADDTSDDLGDLGDNANGAGNGAGNLTSNSDKAKKSLDKLGKAAAIAGAALVGAIGLSVKKAMEFETAMAEVNKTVDFSTNTGLAQLKGELIELSRVIPLPFEELAAITAAGGQVGVADTALRGFTETIAKMAIAFDITAAETATSMAKIASNYRIPIENIGDLGDAINALSNSTAANAGEIIDFMLRVGGSAKQLNITGEAAAAMGAQLVDSGKSVEVAGTAVSKVLQTIGNQDGWVKGQIEAFDSLGLATAEFSRLAAEDGVAALALIQEKVGELASDKQMGMLDAMFGIAGVHASELFLNAESLAEKLTLVGEGAEKTTEHLGSMEEEFRKMSDTSANAMQLTKNMIDAAVASIGEAFLPVLNQLLQDIAPVIDKITVWAQANPELIRTIALVSGALIGSILSIKLFVDAFLGARAMIEGLKEAFTILLPAVKSAFAFLTGSVGLPILAIAALIAAGVLLWKNWDLVKEKASELNEWIKSKFGSLPEPLQQAGRDIAEVFMFIWNTGKEYLTLMSELYSGTFESFKTIATGAFQVVWSIIKVSFSGIVNTISAALQLAATLFSGGFALIKNTVSTVLAVIKAVIAGDFKAIPGIIGDGLKTAAGIVTNMMGNILNIIKEYGKKLYSIGKDFIQGFINGIKSVGSGVASAASTMVGNAIAAVKKRQDSASPSKVTTKLGGDFSQGMANGIKKGAKAVKSEAQKMAESAVKAVQDGVAGLKRELALFGNDSALAALDYDIKVGKFGSANTGELRSLTGQLEAAKAEAKAKDMLADANKSVQDSIDGLIKQQALFGNNSSLASLMYDIEHTEKYKNITQELKDELIAQTKAFEQLGMTAKATQAIQERFAKLRTDQEASGKAVDGVMGELQAETAIGKIQADYERRIEVIRKHEELTTGLIGSEEAKRIAIYESAQKAKELIQIQGNEKLFGELSSITSKFFGEQSAAHKAMFLVEKYFALKRILVENQVALSKAWASASFPYNLPAVATVAAETGLLATAVKGFKQGGYTGNMNASQVAGVVHGQEYVFDAAATKRIGVDNLNAMRSGKSVGGGDVNISVTVDAKGNAQVSGDNERMGRDMANGIKAAVLDVIRKEKRQGGMLYA